MQEERSVLLTAGKEPVFHRLEPNLHDTNSLLQLVHRSGTKRSPQTHANSISDTLHSVFLWQWYNKAQEFFHIT
jgi:hypothetical protein